MRISVGSLNPVKIKAVNEISELVFNNQKIDIFGIDVSSGVSKQPLSLEEIVIGARNRAKNAMLATNSDLAIGLEAGIIKVPYTLTGWIDYAYCAILDKKGTYTMGSSPGFEYPPIVIHRVLNENMEVGDVFDDLVKEKNVKQKQGAIGVLSHGLYNRLEFLKAAVLMAFVPRLEKNRKLYGLP